MFSKKTTAATATKSGKIKTLFVGDKKTSFIIFIGLLLYTLLIAGGFVIFWQYNNYKNQQSNNSSVSDDWVPTDYSEMDQAQISAKLYKDTGKTPTNILDNKVDKDMLPTFTKAYSAAQAMYYLGHYDKALEVYALADTYKSKDKTYEFYLDYAASAQTAKKDDIFESRMEAAKTAVKSDKSLSDTDKADQIAKIDKKLTIVKLEKVQ